MTIVTSLKSRFPSMGMIDLYLARGREIPQISEPVIKDFYNAIIVPNPITDGVDSRRQYPWLLAFTLMSAVIVLGVGATFVMIIRDSRNSAVDAEQYIANNQPHFNDFFKSTAFVRKAEVEDDSVYMCLKFCGESEIYFYCSCSADDCTFSCSGFTVAANSTDIRNRTGSSDGKCLLFCPSTNATLSILCDKLNPALCS